MVNPIRLARFLSGMSQSDFAKAVGVTPGAVGQWENGKTMPNPRKLKLISEVLGVPIERLLTPEVTLEYSVKVG